MASEWPQPSGTAGHCHRLSLFETHRRAEGGYQVATFGRTSGLPSFPLENGLAHEHSSDRMAMATDVAFAIDRLLVRVLWFVSAQQGTENEMKVYQVCPVSRFLAVGTG